MSLRSSGFTTVRWLAVAMVLAVAPAARAQDIAAAQKHFEAAETAYAKKKFVKAAGEYQKAYDITKDPALLFNEADAYEKAKKPKEAVTYYERYLKENPTASDRADVEKKLVDLRKAAHLPPAVVEPAKPEPVKTEPPKPEPPKTEPPKPEPLMKSPFDNPSTEPPKTEPPKTEPPKPEPLMNSDLNAPSTTPTTTPPPPTETTPAPTETAPPPVGVLDEDHPSKLKVVAWVGVAVTVALVTAGAIFGLAAQARSDDISRLQTMVDSNGRPAIYNADTASKYNDLRDTGMTYNAAAIGLLAAGGAIAITSAILFVVDYRGRAAEKHVRLAPTFGPGHAGLAAAWTF